MSIKSIEINNCSAVLYHGTAAIEAHAGNSQSIRTWIEQIISNIGKCHISGWNNLKLLQDAEKEQQSE